MGCDFASVAAFVTTENTLLLSPTVAGQNLIAAKDQSRQKPGARAPSPAECTPEGLPTEHTVNTENGLFPARR